MLLRGLAILGLLLVAACAPLPSGKGVQWVPSPNYDTRRPNFIVLHQTSNDSVDRALATLTDPQREVSAHYLIGRDGKVMQLVDERSRAWHAGASRWGGMSDLNSASIGIELDNTGAEPFPEPQIAALVDLMAGLSERHRIPGANVLAHGDIAPTRKVDPSGFFPWRRLAQAGFGLWCDSPPTPVPGFDADLGLRAFGYDMSVPEAARAAFRRRYFGRNGNEPLTGDEAAMLACLLAQTRAGMPVSAENR